MSVDVHERELPLSEERLIEAIADAATSAGVETYLVGGFVRDRLLGREGKDIDLLAVGDDGTAVLAALARRFHWPPPQRFERFGTGQVRGSGFVVEIVRARAESYDAASRKPDVRPGTLEDDIWRRDFTVNALCQTLAGHVIDITGRGLDDLRHGVLRTPLDPQQTFSEDPLRMFRAARFAAQLGFGTAPGLTAAMSRMAARSEILSAERVAEELRRLLQSNHPRAGLELLRDGGLMAVRFPELEAMVGVEQGGFHIYDVFDHTAHTVAAVPPDLVTRLAALLHDVGKPPTHAVDANGKQLVMITGANQGGKSTFLRSVGVAQLMMQSGMFVAAGSFSANVCDGVFTHFKRQEDSTMESGKLDEELSRMSDIADRISPNCILLCNESFAATNEREGSEIARQLVRALIEAGIKVFFVTHLFDLAHGFYRQELKTALFLRAERKPDGHRTFRLLEGEPLPTSYGEDSYRRIFDTEREPAPTVSAENAR